MFRIIDGRGTGKTSRLLLLAKEANGVIVCANPKAMEYKAHAYGITGLDFYSYSAFLNDQLRGDNRPVFIDEIEGFMRLISNKITGYTLSNED